MLPWGFRSLDQGARGTAIVGVGLTEGDGVAGTGDEVPDISGIFPLQPYLSPRIRGSHITSPLGVKLLLVNAKSVKNKTAVMHD